MTSPAEYVLALLESDHPDPESMAWLRDGLRRYVNGYGTLQDALGIVESCPRGLRDAIRTARVNRSIQAAARLLGPDTTTHSKAVLISSELRRIMRIRRSRRPRTWFESYLFGAVEFADGNPPTSVPRLWAIIDQGIREAGIQADDT